MRLSRILLLLALASVTGCGDRPGPPDASRAESSAGPPEVVQVVTVALPRGLKPGDPLPGGGIFLGERPHTPNVGTIAPDLTLLDADRNPVLLSSFRGKLVVLDIGAISCGPCQRILPELERVAADYAGKGVVVLPVFDNDKWADFAQWLSRPGRPKLRQYIHPTEAGEDDRLGVRGQLNDWSGIPITYLIGPDGKFLYHHQGYDAVKDKGLPDLRKAIDAALGESTATQREGEK